MGGVLLIGKGNKNVIEKCLTEFSTLRRSRVFV
jgi:hypothetical protein